MRRVGSILIVSCVVAAACGGNDEASPTDESDPTAPTSVVTAPPATDPPTTAPPATSSPVTDPPATVPPTTGSPTTDPPDEGPVTILSEDGRLAITVDAADAARVEPSIRILDPSEWPAELAGSEERPGVVIYELEPDGAQFDVPVTVTRRLDIADLGVEVNAYDVPVANLLTRAASGDYELLGDLAVTRLGSALFVSGTTDHFSPIIGAVSDLVVDLPEPRFSADLGAADFSYYDGIDLGPMTDGESFEVFQPPLVLDNGLSLGSPLRPDDTRGEAHAQVRLEERLIGGAADAVIAEHENPLIGAGDGLIAVTADLTDVRVSDLGGAPLFPDELALELAIVRATSILLLAADESTVAKLKVLEAMADAMGFEIIVGHTPFGPFVSSTRKKLTGPPELPDGARLYSATYSGSIEAPALVDLAEMTWDGEGYGTQTGLTQYGPINEAVVLVDGELAPDLVDGTPTPGSWDALRSSDALVGTVHHVSTESGEAQSFDVDANEGPLFSGDAWLVPEPTP